MKREMEMNFFRFSVKVNDTSGPENFKNGTGSR